jgi:hypothetical protein
MSQQLDHEQKQDEGSGDEGQLERADEGQLVQDIVMEQFATANNDEVVEGDKGQHTSKPKTRKQQQQQPHLLVVSKQPDLQQCQEAMATTSRPQQQQKVLLPGIGHLIRTDVITGKDVITAGTPVADDAIPDLAEVKVPLTLEERQSRGRNRWNLIKASPASDNPDDSTSVAGTASRSRSASGKTSAKHNWKKLAIVAKKEATVIRSHSKVAGEKFKELKKSTAVKTNETGEVMKTKTVAMKAKTHAALKEGGDVVRAHSAHVKDKVVHDALPVVHKATKKLHEKSDKLLERSQKVLRQIRPLSLPGTPPRSRRPEFEDGELVHCFRVALTRLTTFLSCSAYRRFFTCLKIF